MINIICKGRYNMINFEEEILKFKPILEIEGIENAVINEEIKDIIDIIKEIVYEKDSL